METPARINPLNGCFFLRHSTRACLYPTSFASSSSIGCLRVLSLPAKLFHTSSAAGGSNGFIATGGRFSNVTGRVHPSPSYLKKGILLADFCIMGPLIVNGLFKTIVFIRRAGRNLNRSTVMDDYSHRAPACSALKTTQASLAEGLTHLQVGSTAHSSVPPAGEGESLARGVGFLPRGLG